MDRPARGPLTDDARLSRRLAGAGAALIALTSALIVLGALVRANEAGLACPDWPLCFGETIPQMDVQIAFEWSHRALAGTVALLFAALAFATLRRPGLRRAVGPLVLAAGVLLVVQIALGALTVLHLLAQWTVTSHLVTGNAFNAALLMLVLALRDQAQPPQVVFVSAAARGAVFASAALLLLQIVLGGLVSSSYAGLACPEWPTCNGGAWFPSFRGSVGLHLLHRLNGYALLAACLAAASFGRGVPRLRRWVILAAALVAAQVAVGVANVLLGLPVEVTGLHSALAAALVLVITGAVREACRPVPQETAFA
jgi:cytochrome c oxidase assembly protein subunit 15